MGASEGKGKIMELLMSHGKRKRIEEILVIFVVLCVVIVLLFPIFWMVISSFKTQADISTYPPKFVFTPTLRNYRAVFTEVSILKHTLNRAIKTGGSVLVSIILGLPAAYGIARYGLSKLALGILIVRMFPFISFLIPWFQMFQRLRLLDTYQALIATHLVITLPLIVWIMMGFFEGLPVSLEEAGLIDGCSKWRVFMKIAVPLVKPGIMASVVLSAIFSWNNLQFALIIGGYRTKTLPLAIQQFMSFEQLQWGQLCAIASLITLPIIVLVLSMQKHLVHGLVSGGLKG